MLEEYQSLIDNDVFEEVQKNSQRIIDTKWVFTVKTNEHGIPTRYKARLVAKGFKQVHGIDYLESYAPVSDKSTIRIFLTAAAHKKQKVYHLDVRRAFLNGELEEEIFIYPPPPFRNERKVWRMKKALYGLKQAPRVWNELMVKLLLDEGFTQSKVDLCLFAREDIITLIYVDDILVSTKDFEKYEYFRDKLNSCLEIHELGVVKKFLGITIKEVNGEFLLKQKDYIRELATKVGITNCNPTSKPLPSGTTGLDSNKEVTSRPVQQLLGSLLFIANSTRPDILAAVSMLARYTMQPTELLWKYTKQVLQYLYTTTEESLLLTEQSKSPLETYVDADFGSDPETRKSQTGFVIRVFGSTVAWYSRKQSTVSMSSTEAEYVALATAASYTCGVKHLLQEIGVEVNDAISLFEDNQPAMQIAKGSSKVKHLDVKLHFVRDLVRRKVVTLVHVASEHQIADCLTKVSPRNSFKVIRKDLGIVSNKGKC